MVGPVDQRVEAVFAGVVPAHAMIAERAPRRSHCERQLVRANRIARVSPHLPARMHGRQRINRHVQDVRDFRGTLFAVDPIGDRYLANPEVLRESGRIKSKLVRCRSCFPTARESWVLLRGPFLVSSRLKQAELSDLGFPPQCQSCLPGYASNGRRGDGSALRN